MASSGRGRSGAAGPAVVPETMPQVLPGQSPMLDHSFTSQAIMELQQSVSELSTKTERLIKGVESQNSKLDAVRHQVSYAKGALLVLAALVTLGGSALANVYVRGLAGSSTQSASPAPAR